MNNNTAKEADFRPLEVSKAYETLNPNIFRFNVLGGQIKKLSDAIILVSIKDKVGNVETGIYKYKNHQQDDDV